MGVGGGFIMVPAMIYLLRMPTRIVIGTSTFQIVFVTAFTTVLQAMQNQSVDVAAGAAADRGRRDRRAVRRRLRRAAEGRAAARLLALLVLAVAVRMAMGLVVHPADLFGIETPPVE